MPYLFGDNERAARRLEVLARVFGDSTRAFLSAQRDAAPVGAEPALLDLGCGPGRTTRLMADVWGSPAVGLDASELFLWEARRLQPQRVAFIHHDTRLTPFPTPPADLMLARFLLSHLEGPEEILRAWSSQLRPGGRILVEEAEVILTDHPTFTTYLSIVEQGLARQNSELYVGQTLARLDLRPALERVASSLVSLEVTDSDAAMMFALNLPTLRQSDAIRGAYEESVFDELQTDLDRLAYSPTDVSRIQWKLRQIVWRLGP